MSDNQIPNPEFVEIINPKQKTDGRWLPSIGEETLDLLKNLTIPEQSKNSYRDEAIKILSRCLPPNDLLSPCETGLVIGYVQSGKTISFTTVAALARDNGYRLVIVVTGVSTPLFNQSKTRLKEDLRLDSRSDRKWYYFENPRPQGARQAIEDTLADWQDSSVSRTQCQTILITVMKNHQHLNHLADLLRELNLDDVPALVIDDEADQAGLNTLVNSGGESPTYQFLTTLRNKLPHHSFLQYTATPQAPLLINIIDALSPNFAEILSPGSEYVGGKDFFIDHPNLIRPIPPNEVPSRTNRLSVPPPTLVDAMLLFFVGVAAGFTLDENQGNRSMMVHPSRETGGHTQYFQWVSKIKENWHIVFSKGNTEPDWHDLISLFHGAYIELARSVSNIPPYDEIIQSLPRAVRRTNITEVNSLSPGGTPHVNWRDNYANILVGGQAMDRGFTVAGLTVTYMPRGRGVGNADTIQQRARFLGYKRAYLGYCRIFLESTVINAYRAYVSHEEDVRSQLIEYSYTGKSLAEWKRQFLLDRSLRPTRKNVLDLPYMQNNFNNTWCIHKSPHVSNEAIVANRSIVGDFLANLELHPDTKIQAKTEITSHLVNEQVSLQLAYEQLLTKLRITQPTDSQNFTGLLLQIRNYLENHPRETCTIFQMSYFNDEWKLRRRRINNNNEIENIFQGANPSDGPQQGSIYPGDANIGDHGRVIIQIRNHTVTKDDNQILADMVPTVAVWVPSHIGSDWLVQDQGMRS